MKPVVLLFFVLASFICKAQSDSLLFHSLERILKAEKGQDYKDQVFISINKYDLERVKIKDTTLIKAGDREFKVILLREPTDKKDFYILPIEFHGDNYIAFRIQNCNRPVNKTFHISYLKQDGVFILDSFEVRPDKKPSRVIDN